MKLKCPQIIIKKKKIAWSIDINNFVGINAIHYKVGQSDPITPNIKAISHIFNHIN